MKEKTSKSEFIRQHPNAPAKEVVSQGKAAGLKFTTHYVYMVRAQGRKKHAFSPSPNGAIEEKFLACVALLGKERAKELLA